MKNWLLYFFAVLVIAAAVPFAAEKATVSDPVPRITVLCGSEVKELSAEEFALCVLVAEGDSLPSFEAKKALAVAARSLASYIDFNGYKHSDFDLCSDPECCVALADPGQAEKTLLDECESAVAETRGEVLEFERLPAAALFTYCAGSGTRDNDEFEYLCAVAEDERCERHGNELKIDYPALSQAIPGLSACTPEELVQNSFIAYDASGKCSFGVFNGACISAETLASSLSLPSAEFKILFDDEDAVITCFGEGSGFGLNLCGAERMAESGKSFAEIIGFYYPKLTLNKIY